MAHFHHASVFIIAEAGVNHNGSLEQAKRLIEVAAEAKADAVKFQTFQAEQLASTSAPLAAYQAQNLGKNLPSQIDLLKGLELKLEDYRTLQNYAKSCEIEFLSTPFDPISFRYLRNELKLNKIKISSGDLLNAGLLLEIASSGADIILSTGMANLEEIESALGVIAFGYKKSVNKNFSKTPSTSAFVESFQSPDSQSLLREKVTLLHCTTQYPAPLTEANILAMVTMRNRFALNVGYSDHTLGFTAASTATALGATMLEKHFTLDKKQEGPDHKCSLEPNELKEFVRTIRETEISLGFTEKKATASEKNNILICRKSLMAAKFIQKGEKFSELNITSKRPASGESSILYWDFIGKTAPKDFQENELIHL